MKSHTRSRTGTEFGAPWAASLWGITSISVALLLGMSVFIPLVLPTSPGGVPWLASIGCLAILVFTAPFAVLGYRIQKDRLLIRRLGWSTRLDLTDLVEARVDPDAMKGSLRTFGNGGLFAFAGWFRNKRLGSYRAFATDPANSVVLVFKNRTVLVTPDHPKRFVRSLGLNDDS